MTMSQLSFCASETSAVTPANNLPATMIILKRASQKMTNLKPAELENRCFPQITIDTLKISLVSKYN